MAAAKDLIDHHHRRSWSSLREVSFDWSDTAFSSADCAEGVRAFRAKTTPQFTDTAQPRTPAPAGGTR